MSAIVQGDKIENKYTFPRKLYTKSAWKNTIINLKNEKKKKNVKKTCMLKKLGFHSILSLWIG